MKKIRIGSGAGYGGDRLEPALDLLEKGSLDYLCLECLAERTIALAQKEKMADNQKGYNSLLEYRMEKILPLAYKNNVTIISNMGAANPLGAVRVLTEMAQKMGLTGLKIAAVLGDDILEKLEGYYHEKIIETGQLLQTLKDQIISANAYLGIDGIVQALDAGAQVIITGRVADPSLFLAPMVHEFGWKENQLLGQGTVLGHLLECAGQVSGGYFANPPYSEVPDLWNLGFPFIEVQENGEAFITKLKDTGGKIDSHTCTEQLLYEIHDPSHYITPDCVADFSKVTFNPLAENKIEVLGGTASYPPEKLKVSVGYHNGYMGVGEISYGGHMAYQRSVMAGEIIQNRLKKLGPVPLDLRIEHMGVNALYDTQVHEPCEPQEVRLRVAGRFLKKEEAQWLVNEVEALYTNGPAGGGGARKNVSEVISVASILVPRTQIEPQIHIEKIL